MKDKSFDIRNIPKADTHNHCNYSVTKKYLRENGVRVDVLDVKNISTLIDFFENTMEPLEYKKETLKMLIDGNIKNCIDTGVTKLHTSLNYRICIQAFDSNVDEYICFLKQFQNDNLEIKWILDISRDRYEEWHRELVKVMIAKQFFAGIDLAGTENIKPNNIFKEFFDLAEQCGVDKYVHTGEQLGAEYVRECIVDFSPKYIQHGIGIVGDSNTIELAKSKNIIFNVCPTSNVLLGYVKDIKSHPIKQMVEAGLMCTLGTDDLTVFDSDINNEYQLLLDNNVLTAEQLEQVRTNGLEC